ncbi:MAG: hypothetical protein ABI600_17825 [Luteolibacter sp.]
MKTTLFLTAATVTALHAGTPTPVAIEPAPEPQWIIPTLDARLRYEFANIQGSDDSNALTIRARPGLKTGEWHGFSALAEGEFTGALVDDYNGGAPGADPFDPANSVIADPQNAELNRASIQYQGYDTTVIVGRQRIIYNNAAFVGNSGWRQNEQTFDAASVGYEAECGFKVSYAWVDQVNRIYGEQADGAFSSVDSNVHLINASYSGFENVTLGSYVYLMDFHDKAVTGWDNNTYGIFVDTPLGGIKTHAEFAMQTEAGPLNDQDALYFHINASKEIQGFTVMAGVEQLDNGFQTPLATLHGMNGFADTTDGLRAAGTTGGLTDNYISLTAPLPWELKWTNVAHFFGNNSIGTQFGFGWDSLLVKKFNDHFSATAMLGYFDSNDSLYLSATKASIQIDYTF